MSRLPGDYLEDELHCRPTLHSELCHNCRYITSRAASFRVTLYMVRPLVTVRTVTASMPKTEACAGVQSGRGALYVQVCSLSRRSGWSGSGLCSRL